MERLNTKQESSVVLARSLHGFAQPRLSGNRFVRSATGLLGLTTLSARSRTSSTLHHLGRLRPCFCDQSFT